MEENVPGREFTVSVIQYDQVKITGNYGIVLRKVERWNLINARSGDIVFSLVGYFPLTVLESPVVGFLLYPTS